MIDDTDELKLKLNPADSKAYQCLFDSTKTGINGSNIINNFEFFKSKIERLNDLELKDLLKALNHLKIMLVNIGYGEDPQKIFNYIQLTPVRKEGIVGYAVKPGADRSLFDASGFKEGDIAIALNQHDFTDPRAMIALMRQLPSMDSIQLTVLRKGARHDISIALR